MGCCETPKYTFTASLVGAGWQKRDLNLKIAPKSEVFAPLVPNEGSANFFYHHCKGKVFTYIFYVESLFVSNVFR